MRIRSTQFILIAAIILSISQLTTAQHEDSQVIDQKTDEGNIVKYTRVYCDSTGESHFEDVLIELREAVFAPPAPPLNVSEFLPATKYGYISAAPGWYGDWHPVPNRQLMIYLQGEVEAEVSDGEIRRFGPGSVTLVEDTFGKGHRSRVIGDMDGILVVLQLEEQGELPVPSTGK